jgi:hypothetical protein
MWSQLSTSKGSVTSAKTGGELPESPSMTNPSLGVEVAGVQPHNTRHSEPASS